MGIKIRINKGLESVKEPIKMEGSLLSNVTGKIILKTPFGTREIASDGNLKSGRVKTEPIESVIADTEVKMSTSKPTSKPKKGSK